MRSQQADTANQVVDSGGKGLFWEVKETFRKKYNGRLTAAAGESASSFFPEVGVETPLRWLFHSKRGRDTRVSISKERRHGFPYTPV